MGSALVAAAPERSPPSSISSSSSSLPLLPSPGPVTEGDVEEALEEMARADVKQFDLLGDLVRVRAPVSQTHSLTGAFSLSHAPVLA